MAIRLLLQGMKTMNITLRKATFDECTEIHKLQVASFTELLKKYNDIETNPATETLETIKRKFNQVFTTYYFIMANDVKIGAVRLVKLSETACRISPIFILPEYQNKGYARKAMLALEAEFSDVVEWNLDTIKQEEKLCYFYEKLGYKRTGKEEDIKPGMTIAHYQKIIN